MKQALVVGLLGFFALCAAGQAADKVPELLPADTLAYARLADFRQFYALFSQSGLKRVLLEQAGRKDEKMLPEAEAWDRMAAQVRSLHLSFHGGVRYRRHVNVQLLLVADVGRTVNLPQWLPPAYAGMLVEIGRRGETQLYEIASEELRDERVQVLLVSVKDKVLVATDLMLMGDALEALDKGRAKSLAGNSLFQAATKGQENRDVLVYAAPEFISVLAGLLPRRERADLLAIVEVLSLRDSRCASYAEDYTGTNRLLRLLMRPDSPAYRLIAQPEAAPRAPDYVPGSASLLLSANIGDGARTWRRLNGYLRAKLLRIGEAESVGEYNRELAQAQDVLTVDLDDAAAVVRGEIGLFFGEVFNQQESCLLGFVRDRAEAEKTMRGIERGLGGDTRTEDVRGVKLHTVTGQGGLRWTIVDNCVLLGPEAKGVTAAISARQEGTTLGGSAPYRRLAAKLHPRGVCLFVLNAEPFLKARQQWSDMPPPLQEWMAGVLFGASLTAGQGVVEVRLAASKKTNLLEILAVAGKALQHRMAQPERPEPAPLPVPAP